MNNMTLKEFWQKSHHFFKKLLFSYLLMIAMPFFIIALFLTIHPIVLLQHPIPLYIIAFYILIEYGLFSHCLYLTVKLYQLSESKIKALIRIKLILMGFILFILWHISFLAIIFIGYIFVP